MSIGSMISSTSFFLCRSARLVKVVPNDACFTRNYQALGKHFSTDATAAATPANAAAAPAKKGGAGLLQRLSSFLVGAGLTALGTQWLIFHELHEGNKQILDRQAALESRVLALEKRK